MDMIFGPMSDYKVTLFFSFFSSKTRLEFAFLWFFIALVSASTHYLKLQLMHYEIKISKFYPATSTNSASHLEWMPLIAKAFATNSDSQLLKYRILHSLFSSVSYAVSLLLMFVAMTCNSSLFISLVMGYGVGDFIFYIQRQDNAVSSSFDSNDLACH